MNPILVVSGCSRSDTALSAPRHSTPLDLHAAVLSFTGASSAAATEPPSAASAAWWATRPGGPTCRGPPSAAGGPTCPGPPSA
eukprot:CAMPEP_0196717166 /NCGR_PEP_ID=MMETSP1091-20130531/586_1 /TAXON_ID=302021 /ORGANISM="Rhodomonas sp., Strain CCMP768" /LENGTH=82 /DNA_ID=CAMNT_0042057415 /DNA_START=45 /DNA_END=289 /DNA_ORIENTATION=+